MARWVFINDDLIEEDKGFVHYRDLSFQRGYGVFDVFRLKGNDPLFLEDHLNRFYSSAKGMHLQIGFTKEEVKTKVGQLIKENNLPGTAIRISLTGGYSTDGFTIAKPNLIISQHSFTSLTLSRINDGITLMSYPHQRQLSHIKTIDYLMAIWLQPLLKEKGFDDLLYHQNKFITECPRSNFFMVTKDDVVVTPDNGVLKGVTRMKILELAEKYFAVEERPIHLDEIKTAKEVFITSTTKQLLPVAQVDDTVLPERKTSLKLLELFQSLY